jgi:hypothetical protein
MHVARAETVRVIREANPADKVKSMNTISSALASNGCVLVVGDWHRNVGEDLGERLARREI